MDFYTNADSTVPTELNRAEGTFGAGGPGVPIMSF